VINLQRSVSDASDSSVLAAFTIFSCCCFPAMISCFCKSFGAFTSKVLRAYSDNLKYTELRFVVHQFFIETLIFIFLIYVFVYSLFIQYSV